MGHRADLPTTKGGDEVKLIIDGNGVRVKVEVNFVFRGTVLPVVQRPLISTAQNVFTTDITLPVLDTAELYGSKLVAAMDRQHPRDMFDVLKMIERFGWQPSFVDGFVAYLAGHNRPVHEVLFPKTLPLEPALTDSHPETAIPAHLNPPAQRCEPDRPRLRQRDAKEHVPRLSM